MHCIVAGITVLSVSVSQAASPAAAARGVIADVRLEGDRLNPLVRVTGTNLGSQPPPAHAGSPSELCGDPKPGDTSKDYGSSLYFLDTKAIADPYGLSRWAAGRSGGPYFSCIGLVVESFTSTEVTFRFGPWYDANAYQLNEGDSIRVVVNGASLSTIADYEDAAPKLSAKGRVVDATAPTTITWRPVRDDACYSVDISQSYDESQFDRFVVGHFYECASDGRMEVILQPYLNGSKATHLRLRIEETQGTASRRSASMPLVAGKYLPNSPPGITPSAWRMAASWGLPIRGGGWPVSGNGVAGTSTVLMCDSSGNPYVVSNEHVLGHAPAEYELPVPTFLAVDPPGSGGIRWIRVGEVLKNVSGADVAVSSLAPYAVASDACARPPVVRLPDPAGHSGKKSPKASSTQYIELEVVGVREPTRDMTVLWGGLTTGRQGSAVRGITDAECRDAADGPPNPSLCVDDGGYTYTSGAAFVHLVEDNQVELVGIMSHASPDMLDHGEYEAGGFPASIFPAWLQLP